MNMKRVLSGASVLALLLAASWWLFGGSSDTASRTSSRRGTGSTAAADMEPMAGMDMSTDGWVRLTANQIRQFGITFGTVDRRTLEADLRTVGVVNFDETRIVQVTPKFDGFVEHLYVDFTGQPVGRGESLLAIYSPALVAAQEELLLAKQLQQEVGPGAVPGLPTSSTDLVASAERRLQLWDISERQIEKILRTGEVQRTLTLHSPASGVVVEKSIQEGQAVEAGETLYTIADISEVWVEADIREADAGLVQVGSLATIELTAYPRRTFEGRVEYVYPTIERETRTLTARVAVPNPDQLLKPGMYATVRIETPIREALTVPASAMIRTGERAVVFVDMTKGRLMPHAVELGRVSEEYAEVLTGLEPGQRVVTSAQFLLESESNLSEVMKSMMSQMGLSDVGSREGMDMQGADMKGMSMPREQR